MKTQGIPQDDNITLKEMREDHLTEEQEIISSLKTNNQRLEAAIVFLKQMIIPFVISIENMKDSHAIIQDDIKVHTYHSKSINQYVFKGQEEATRGKVKVS